MFNKINNWALENRAVVVYMSAIILILGVYISLRIPVDVFPDLTAPTVTILTEAHGMAPEEAELLISFPIESAMNGAANVRRVRSISAIGLSIVWVEFDWGMDIYNARQIVNEKLQQVAAQLPPESDPPFMAPISSLMGEMMLISISGENVSPMDLRSIADWEIRRRLLSVRGVSQVIPIGGDVKQYHVTVDPLKMREYKISFRQIESALEDANENSASGFTVQSGMEYIIRGLGRIKTLEDLRNSVITTVDSKPIFLRHVAEVDFGPKIKRGMASVNREPAVIVSIMKQPDTNTLKLTKDLNMVLDDIQAKLPSNIIINKEIFNQADFINVAIANVFHAIRDGAILVIIVLFIFLFNFRTTFISSIAIPLSLLLTIFVMKLTNVTINTMTLGGMAIAVGILVDDGIVSVENIFRRLKQNNHVPDEKKKGIFQVVLDASNEIRNPILFATLIIILVFAPLFFLSGFEGRLLRPLGLTYIISIFASLIVALTVTPVLSYYFLPRSKVLKRREDTVLIRWLKKIYKPILIGVLKHPKKVLFVAFALVGMSIALIPFLGRSFLPNFNKGTLTLSVNTAPGTSLGESDKIGDMVETILLDLPEVISTARRTGRSELDEHAQEVTGAEIDVKLSMRNRNKERLLAELRRQLSLVPGTFIGIGQPISHRIDHLLSGTKSQIAVKIFGPDIYQLRVLGNRIKNLMEEIEGVVDLAIEQQHEIPQIQIKFNRTNMGRYGLTTHDVAENIEIAFQGKVVSHILEGQRSFEVVLKYDDKFKEDLESIKRTLIDTPVGQKIPLQQVADIRYEKGPNFISREDVQRKIVVHCNVAGKDLRSVVSMIKSEISSKLDIPPDYYIDFGGQFESEEKASKTILIVSLISLLSIFVLLAISYHSIKSAMLIIVNLPLALIGGIVAVFLSGGILSVPSLVGFVTLLGIATRNGIMLISHYNHLMREEKKTLYEAVIQGSLERLIPILMTALTTSLALIPLAIRGNAPGNEIQSPMAIVILGGLITATFLNMVVMPVLFHRYFKAA
ncbi:MAG: CusA/CzcA family heavy metal efflux RND transporter [Acidobacteria bacterium]|nr:CusA/CzcA family heavy metal efflux RND transporter [Acidobacteriota bacterium]